MIVQLHFCSCKTKKKKEELVCSTGVLTPTVTDQNLELDIQRALKSKTSAATVSGFCKAGVCGFMEHPAFGIQAATVVLNTN